MALASRLGIDENTLPLDVAAVRRDFPALGIEVRGKPLVYLDNAATSQKPHSVIDAVSTYYETSNANVHRGVHYLSERATEAYEGSRSKVQRFLNAAKSGEIVFVRGTTEALNLVAHSFARPRLSAGDEIVVTAMEHHSNIVPWQILCEETGAELKVCPMNERGELQIEELPRLLGPRTKLLSLVHISNSLGTINPVRKIIELAHDLDIPVAVDGAQAAPHLRVDVQGLNCDFYAISGHKMFGPTGIGALYAKEEHLAEMVPYQGGGEMIRRVSFERTEYADPPQRFEAGTPHISGAVGMGAAVDYLNNLNWCQVARHEQDLLRYANQRLSEIEGLRVIGTAAEKASVVSFVLETVHAHDLGTLVDQEGVAIRTGHHCTQPVMDFFGLPATARASLAFYNTEEEVDCLVEALIKAKNVFHV